MTPSVPSLPAQQRRPVQSDGLLRQPGQRPDRRPVGEHRGQPGHLRAHRAEAHDARAAGVGGDGAPDGRRVAAGEVDRRVEPGGPGVGAPRGQRDAGPGGHLRGAGVDRRRARSAGGVDTHDHRPRRGHAAADEAGVAALGDERRAGRRRTGRRPPPPRRSSAGRTTSRASPWKRPVQSRGVRRRDVGVREHVLGADDLGERRPGGRRHGGPSRAGRSSSVCSARPTGPSSSNSRASARPDPVRLPVRRHPAAQPLADRVAVQGDRRGRC